MTRRIYVALHDFTEHCVDTLRDNVDEVVVREREARADEGELAELAEQFDAIIIGGSEPAGTRVAEAASRLRVLGTTSVGLDHIDADALRDAGVQVVNTPTANVESVAEFTVMAILALQTRFHDAATAGLRGQGRKAIGGARHELMGRTIGLMGAGNIAYAVAKRLRSWPVSVLAYTRDPSSHPEMTALGVQMLSAEAVVASSDVVSLHLPLNDETQRLVRELVPHAMREGAVLVNTARPALCDLDDLLDALESGRLRGLVVDGEVDPQVAQRFAEHRNAVVTPHTAGITHEAIVRMDYDVTSAVIEALGAVHAEATTT